MLNIKLNTSITLITCIILCNSAAFALGNHPESSTCPLDKPYYPICTHSLHNLEGWYGDCFDTQEQAQQAADKHADKEHAGNTRWTGVLKSKARGGQKY